MGALSKLDRFREAGEPVNSDNISDYGEPVCSYFTSTEIFSLRHHIDITDGEKNIVYQADTKAFSLKDETDVTDAGGNPIAHIEQKMFSVHERHFVTMADGTSFELSNELFHLAGDVINVEGLGWQIRGNLLGLNFELCGEDGSVIAVIGQKALSAHEKYCIDIYEKAHEEKAIALLVALQHMLHDREINESASVVTK